MKEYSIESKDVKYSKSVAIRNYLLNNIFQDFCFLFIILVISLALAISQGKYMTNTLAIALVGPSLSANSEQICKCLLLCRIVIICDAAENYNVPYRFINDTSLPTQRSFF